MKLLFITLCVFSWFCLDTTVTLAISLSKPGCQEKCGNVTIPYPFGIGSECSADPHFTVICRNSTTPFIKGMEVVKISLYGTFTVKLPISPLNCSDVQTTVHAPIDLVGSSFSIPSYYNSFVVLGCTTSVWTRSDTEQIIGGCLAICDANSTDTTCSGVNCCQTAIPDRSAKLDFTYRSIEASNTSFCGYAFPADKKWIQYVYTLNTGLMEHLSNPYDPGFRFGQLVLDWEYVIIEDRDTAICRWLPSWATSELRDKYYSPRYDSTGNNYISSVTYCYCRDGFEGNPYLGREGCRDIDECSNSTLNIWDPYRGKPGCLDEDQCSNSTLIVCAGEETCINTVGGYTCRKRSYVKIVSISVGSGFGALSLVLGVWFSIKIIRKRMEDKHRRKCLGLLLEQQLSLIDNGVEKTRLFRSRELAQATDHYNENRVLGHGGQGTVYKGMLTNGRIVAVKKSKKIEESDLVVFINEVVILSQINHRNVVKLLGCCLETEVPLLVYEFVPNGTLYQHIHDPSDEFPLTWELRVRIAREVAGALAYMHSAASAPIYHRDIKSTNILLDDKYRAKVSDFGTSRSVAVDQTHLTTRVLGTFGYLDPEYFQSSQFTEKSDVYSFGVVMVELLTGEKAVSAVRVKEGRGLAAYFLHSLEENQLFEILDARVLKEGKPEEILAIAELARRCLHMNGKRRPTMKEVELELEGLHMVKEGTCFVQNEDEREEWNGIEITQSDGFSSISGSMLTDITSQEAQCLLLDEPRNNISIS